MVKTFASGRLGELPSSEYFVIPRSGVQFEIKATPEELTHMADQSQLAILQQSVTAWNTWRARNPSIIIPDLSGVNLYEANLYGANLSRANLYRANLSGAYLVDANLSGDTNLSHANLSGANLSGAYLPWAYLFKADLMSADLSYANLGEANLSRVDLSYANLGEANLSRVDLLGANLSEANLSEANLSEADLSRSTLVKTNLTGTTLTGCRIYGISAWSLELEGAKQQNLNVSDYGEPAIMVDNLEVAQFIYLLLNNERIRQVIDTITSKVVLILGRFTSERKDVLDAIRESLRQHDYLPVLFDFDRPSSRDLTETISTLAHMARFIIADITEAKSIPQELQAIVPNLPSVPVQPLLLNSDREYGMFEHFGRYPWVLDTYYYDNLNEVLVSVEDKVISPAETKARELSS
jgi:uncharacterized protein YjbI with pentapeptide repeats